VELFGVLEPTYGTNHPFRKDNKLSVRVGNILKECCKVEYIFFENTHLNYEDLWNILTPSHCFPKMAIFHLKNNSLGRNSIALISNQRFPALKSLTLENNELDAYCHIEDVLHGLPNLISLSLASNPLLGDSGLMKLEQALADLKNLNELNLCATNASDGAAQMLVRIQSNFKTLKRLVATNNHISGQWVVELCRAYVGLMQLDLSYNEFGSESVHQILELGGPSELYLMTNAPLDFTTTKRAAQWMLEHSQFALFITPFSSKRWCHWIQEDMYPFHAFISGRTPHTAPLIRFLWLDGDTAICRRIRSWLLVSPHFF